MAVPWWQIVLTIVCIFFSGVFSGLTLGLMALDLVDLRVLIESGTPRQSKAASRIEPVRRHGNFLLCTLLMGNTAVNSALSIVSSQIFGGVPGFILSTLCILFIGEILPQAICHRHGLEIGSRTIPFVKFVMAVTSPLSWPTSKALDCFLGGESATLYNKRQLKSLVTIHAEVQDPHKEDSDPDLELGLGPSTAVDGEHNSDDDTSNGVAPSDISGRRSHDEENSSGQIAMKRGRNGRDKKSKKKGPGRMLRRRKSDRSSRDSRPGPAPALTRDEMTILEGALDFSNKSVVDVMTPLNKIFMLSSSMVLDFKAMMLIFHSGHSRIPVFEKERSNIVGYVFAKDLILLDPDESIPLKRVLSFFNRTPMWVKHSTDLNKMLNIFKSGRGHMAIVQKVVSERDGEDQTVETVGIVTLEDLIEELIGDEIVDETDVYTNNSNVKRVHRVRRFDAEILRLFYGHDRVEEKLTDAEVRAVASYLADNVKEFRPELVSKRALNKVLKESRILHFADSGGNSRLASSSMTSGEGQSEKPQSGVGQARSNESPLMGYDQFDKDGQRLPSHWDGLVGGNVPDREGDNSPIVYKREVPTSDAYLIISGRLKVCAGSDGFISEVGPWNMLGTKALSNNLYAPDFTASVTEFPTRLLKITRKQYRAMMRLRPHGYEHSSYLETSGAKEAPSSDAESASASVSASEPQSNQIESGEESTSGEEGG